jgi:error-prone DNA polymerase
LGPSYAELHCRTNFSFLEGASHAEELAARAAELGHAAIAVTDRNSLAGVVRAHVAAKEAKIKLLVGAELTPIDAPPLLVWCPDRKTYGRLARLLTVGRRAAPKGECRLTFADIAQHSAGLLAGVLLAPCLPFSATFGADSNVAPNGKRDSADHLHRYKEMFADRCYAVAELHRSPNDRRLLQEMMRLAGDAGLPLVAANDVHYHVAERRPLQDVLTAIRHGCTVAELGDRIFPNAERHLKSPAEMLELFADCPDAVARTVEVAERCTFSLAELRYEYPEELSPPGITPFEYLTQLTWEGARERYACLAPVRRTGAEVVIPDKVRRLVEYELQLIQELRYEAYFLTVWDVVRFARSRGILCQGRGSAANSAVCFCLGVTSVDPDRIDVLFERFVSKERNEAPDIDVDFEHERREEVLQYLYSKYGRDRAGLTAEVITYQGRSAARDVGKALGLSLDRLDVLADNLDHYHDSENLPRRCAEAGVDPQSMLGRQLVALVEQIVGFPRHLSQHVGGMVMTQGPLCELAVIENAAMPDRTVIQWDKDDLDSLGILKVDCLALGMLTAIRKCFDLVTTHHSPLTTHPLPLTLANVPAEDREVYEMCSRGDTIGVFQIESRAQMSMLPRLQPREFYDLVIEVAIVRPGPIQGDMVHPYLRRRNGEEPVDYPDERIRAVLEKTLGVPIFQEQAMRLAVVAAGFTPGEADQLRRAMGAWRRRGVIEVFRKKLLDGMRANGYTEEFAARIFKQLSGFGEYGFPESHAASFALLVYVSAWLKHYYPAAFAAALINSQPMGFYAPAQLISDARKHGVLVRPIDVNDSAWDCALGARSASEGRPSLALRAPPDHPSLRLGFRLINGLSRAAADRIVAARTAKPFVSWNDFIRRTRLSSAVLKKLAQADVFGSLGVSRREALWRALPSQESLPLFELAEEEETPAPLPPMTALQEVVADYGAAGMTLRQHPISFVRTTLAERGAVPAEALATLKDGIRVKVAGLVLLRQRPATAKGITFVTLEDETGIVNLIVRQEIWERYRRAAKTAKIMFAHGTLQRQKEIIHVLVTKIENFSARLAIDATSRDFR